MFQFVLRNPALIANATNVMAKSPVQIALAWSSKGYVRCKFCLLEDCIFLIGALRLVLKAHAPKSTRLALQGTDSLRHWYQKVSNDPS